MDITPVITKQQQLIQSYGDGGFTISNERREGSVILFPDQCILWPDPALTLEALAPLFDRAERSTILLFGMGKSFLPIPTVIRDACRARGITAEPMDTGAACRTFNILMSEERPVAAALMAV